AVAKQLAAVNGDGAASNGENRANGEQPSESAEQPNGGSAADTPAERLRLAAAPPALPEEQRRAQADYVGARGLTGTGGRVARYPRLLHSCLPPEDHEMLDENLDDLIKMMEDEADLGAPSGPGAGPTAGLGVSLPGGVRAGVDS